MLRILPNASSSVHSAGAHHHDCRCRPQLLNSRILNCHLLVRCCAHKGPLTKPAAPQRICLEETVRQLQSPAKASIEQLPFWYPDVPGELDDCAGQHVESSGVEVAAFLELGKYIRWILSENGSIDEVLPIVQPKSNYPINQIGTLA